MLQPPTFIGLDNYRAIFNDPLFWQSLTNTLYLVVVGIPIYTIVDIAVAVLLNTKVVGQTFYRTVIFLPTLIPAVVLSILWLRLLDTAKRAGQRRAVASQHQRARLVFRPRLVETQLYPVDAMGNRKFGGDLPGGPAERRSNAL